MSAARMAASRRCGTTRHASLFGSGRDCHPSGTMARSDGQLAAATIQSRNFNAASVRCVLLG